jgi:hypothetical protein
MMWAGRAPDGPPAQLSRPARQFRLRGARGVAPDVGVEFDPQLKKAVEVVLAELTKNPPARPQRPASPGYYESGAKEPAEGK